MKPVLVRRIVRTLVATAIEQSRSSLESFIAGHLQYPESFRYRLSEPAVTIREIRDVRLTPQFQADYPPLEIVLTVQIRVTANTRSRGADLGRRTFAIDAQVNALGVARGIGYALEPHAARLVAWWGYE